MFHHASSQTSRLSDERSEEGQQRRYRHIQEPQLAPVPLRQLRSQASSTSLSSKKSASRYFGLCSMSNKDTSINPPWACLTSSPEIFRSFETVINMGLQHQQHQRHHQQHPEEARHDVGEERRWATRENLVSADSEDNTEEENGVDDGARPPPCRTAWGEVGGDKRRLRGVSRTSSGSTSDDDKRGGSGAGAKGGGSDGGDSAHRVSSSVFEKQRNDGECNQNMAKVSV